MKSKADLRTPSTPSRQLYLLLLKRTIPILNIDTENAKFLSPKSNEDFDTTL